MPRKASGSKRREWESRLGRFRRSSQKVSDFCAAEEVSAASFYYWRRRIGTAGENARGGERVRRDTSVPRG